MKIFIIISKENKLVVTKKDGICQNKIGQSRKIETGEKIRLHEKL